VTRVIVSGRGEKVGRLLGGRLRKVAQIVLAAEAGAIADRCEVGITLVGVDEIRALNATWRDEPTETDVLSFPLHEDISHVEPSGPILLGDVVICPAAATLARGEDAVARCVVLAAHGILHLVGYDHAVEEDKAVMFALQERYAKEAARG
jgi:probable rRNA maturation factor